MATSREGRPDWAGIYLAYQPVMRAAARKVLGGPNHSRSGVSVDDVLQTTMAEVMRKGIPADIESIPKFLATVASRRALDVTRAAQRRKEGPTTSEREDTGGVTDPDEVEVKAVQAVQFLEVYRHLHVLPPRERHVLIERVMKQRPAKEVAEELDVTPQRISQLVAQALDRCRAVIGRERQ